MTSKRISSIPVLIETMFTQRIAGTLAGTINQTELHINRSYSGSCRLVSGILRSVIANTVAITSNAIDKRTSVNESHGSNGCPLVSFRTREMPVKTRFDALATTTPNGNIQNKRPVTLSKENTLRSLVLESWATDWTSPWISCRSSLSSCRSSSKLNWISSRAFNRSSCCNLRLRLFSDNACQILPNTSRLYPIDRLHVPRATPAAVCPVSPLSFWTPVDCVRSSQESA